MLWHGPFHTDSIAAIIEQSEQTYGKDYREDRVYRLCIV